MSTGQNSSGRPDAFANGECTREAKTNHFLSPHCNEKTVERVGRKSGRASTVEMYLRIKPAPTVLEKNYAVLDSRTLWTFLPFEDKSIPSSRCAKSSEAEARRHAFTKIFGSETSQAEMFEGSIKHRVAEFLGGKSSTIMTYGMRDSGKTYTLFGTSASPGIITRSIELVFSAINCTIAPWCKPTFRGTVHRLNKAARASETRRRIRVLNKRSAMLAEARQFLENSRLENADPEECCGESTYTVWLSFAEIYNGKVYDLLDGAKVCTPLILYKNARGRACLRGFRKVHAITALEACQMLMTCQSDTVKARRNHRSHTIFTIELLKYQKDHAAEKATLSTLTFCDLAGSTQFEESCKSEAISINNSLLVLGQCLKAVGKNHKAPFRQSKLTQICQRAFSGKENLNIIVNVAFQPSLSDQTQSIFKFCDIVRKLLANEECKQSCDFGRIIQDAVVSPSRTFKASPTIPQSSSETAGRTDCIDSAACKSMREQNEKLKQELDTVISDVLNGEYAIRQQLADHYSHVVKELGTTYKENTKRIKTEIHDLLKRSVKKVESFYKERIDNLMRHKKKNQEDRNNYVQDKHALHEELKAENAWVTSKVAVLKEAMKKLRKENKTILCEKNKCSFELALITEELKKFRQLTRAGIRKWGGSGENIGDGADSLMNNLERLMEDKVKRTEEKLDEMNEYIRGMKSEDPAIASETARESSKSQVVSDDAAIKVEDLEEKLSCSQIAVEDNVKQTDCAALNKWNYQETLHVAELSQDLETIRAVIYALNCEATGANKCQLPHKEEALEQFIELESEFAIKRDDLFRMIGDKMQEYKHEICELLRKLAVKEENESRISERARRYMANASSFKKMLSSTQNRLDEASSKCANEHLPKITSLEEEVIQKTLQVNELEGKISKIQNELARDYELFQKIHDFDIIVYRCQRDKNELRRQLYECFETQLTLEDKLKKLTMKIAERESEVVSLKSEVCNITELNVASNEKARNLTKQITEADENIELIKEDLYCCEDLRKNVENTMEEKIHDFRSRLSDDKDNTTILNEICKTYSDSQDEITRLKMQLKYKELQATLLKTDRDATIKKYEILLRHIQNKIKEKDKHFQTVANSLNNVKRSSTENQRQAVEILKDHEAENSFAISSCFMPKLVSSEALNISSK